MSGVSNKETNNSNDSSNMKNNEGNNNNYYYNKANSISEKQNLDNQKTNTNINGINNNNKNIDVDYSPFLLSPPEHQQNQMNMDNTLRNNSNFNDNQQKQQSQQNTFDSASTDQTKTPLTNPNNNINDNNNINSNKSTNSSKNSPAVEKFVNKHSRSNSNRETTSNGVKRSRKQSSESNASLHERPEKKECDHCRRRQTQCVQVPNLKNCVQCESKGIKCTYSEIVSNKSTFELEQIKKRVDENVNVHDLLKRTKYDTSTKASSMPSQVANTNQNANQQSQLMNNIMGQNFNSLQGILDPSSISNANNNGQRNALSNSNGILSPDILNAMSPLNFNPNNNNTSNNNNSNINLTNALASAFNSINSKGNLNNNNNNNINNNTLNSNLLSGIVSNLLMNNMNPGNNPNQQQASPSHNFNSNDLNFSYIPKNNSNNNLNQNFNNDVNGINNMGQLPQNLNAMSLASIYSQLTGNSFPQQPPSSFFNNNNNNMNVNNSNNIINSSNNNSNSTINIAANNVKPSNPNGAPSYPRSSFYLGPTSLIDYNLINHVKVDKIDQIQISPSLALRKVAPNVQFLLRDDFNEKLYLKQEQELDLVEKLIHPHGKTLVDIFFKVVHPHYPILHEKVFMEKYSRSYRELTTPLLASIYCLSLEWWEFHPQLIGFPKPDVKKQLMDIAIRSFFEVVERPKLSIVQAGLLILKCRSETSNNWVIASEVVALAEELGLGIDCQEWRLPKWERGLRRRLAWAVWSMEKWTSSNEGRFSHLILGRNWMVKMLSDEDFPNDIGTHSLTNKKNGTNNNNNSFNGGTPNTNISNNTPNNALNGAGLNSNGQPMLSTSILDSNLSSEEIKDKKQLFQQYVSLSIILGEILDTFYTLGAMSVTNNIEYVLKLAKPLQLKLREWYHSLPPKLSMNHLEQGKFNSNAALTLAYFGTEICLHRKILTILDSDKSPGNTPELKKVCRDAANTRVLAAIDFVSDLKPEHINGFWYSCSSNNLSLIGSFIALLYCTSDSLEEKNTYRGYLKKYINILKTSLVNFQKAQLALEFSQLLDDILI